ncbi:MAG: hypothetical protein AAF604_12030 [Acidobacteriota bacterium]
MKNKRNILLALLLLSGLAVAVSSFASEASLGNQLEAGAPLPIAEVEEGPSSDALPAGGDAENAKESLTFGEQAGFEDAAWGCSAWILCGGPSDPLPYLECTSTTGNCSTGTDRVYCGGSQFTCADCLATNQLFCVFQAGGF